MDGAAQGKVVTIIDTTNKKRLNCCTVQMHRRGSLKADALLLTALHLVGCNALDGARVKFIMQNFA